MKVQQRYEMQRGVERVTFNLAGPDDQVLVVTKGRIRFWYMRGGNCLQPAIDCGAGEVCQVEGGRPFASRPLSLRQLFYIFGRES